MDPVQPTDLPCLTSPKGGDLKEESFPSGGNGATVPRSSNSYILRRPEPPRFPKCVEGQTLSDGVAFCHLVEEIVWGVEGSDT